MKEQPHENHIQNSHQPQADHDTKAEPTSGHQIVSTDQQTGHGILAPIYICISRLIQD